METDCPAIATRYGYTLLQRLLSYTEEAQEDILELGKLYFVWFTKIHESIYTSGVLRRFVDTELWVCTSTYKLSG